jgi:hypothetical protein
MNRTAIAFFVAPLAATMLLVPYIHSMKAAPSLFVFALEISLVVAYGGSVIFGIPAYLLLRAHNWTAFWIAPLVGFLIGMVMWLVFSALFALMLGEGTLGVHLTLTDANMLKGLIWPGGVLGAVVGAAFWLIARPDHQTR